MRHLQHLKKTPNKWQGKDKQASGTDEAIAQSQLGGGGYLQNT